MYNSGCSFACEQRSNSFISVSVFLVTMSERKPSPVSWEKPAGVALENQIGLCLSGGGYRAMLFHLGVLWRLAEFGYLGSDNRTSMHGPVGSLQRVSSVSGGSISSAQLALAWDKLKVDEAGAGDRFRSFVAEPVQEFASQSTVTFWSGLLPALVGRLNRKLVKDYRKKLFGDASLQDLPDVPRFILNATNLQSGELWRFSKERSRDKRVGEIERPQEAIAKVVGASSAFPPFLSPARFAYDESQYTPGSGTDLQRPPFTTRPLLSDGGVYDNLGLETVFNDCRTIICSNAGGKYQAKKHVHIDWLRQTHRVLVTIDNQVRTLRKDLLVEALKSKERLGVYWSIRGDIAEYPAKDKLHCPYKRTIRLASMKTDLEKKDPTVQRRLINWGYGICDAGIRSWLENELPAPHDFPYPLEGV
jgi:NTE family protein